MYDLNGYEPVHRGVITLDKLFSKKDYKVTVANLTDVKETKHMTKKTVSLPPALLERYFHLHKPPHIASQGCIQVRIVPAPRPPRIHADVIILQNPVQPLR